MAQPHLRIAMIVGKFPVLSETFIVNQVRGLRARGHDVDIYALYGGPDGTERTLCEQGGQNGIKAIYPPRPTGKLLPDISLMLMKAAQYPEQAGPMWRLAGEYDKLGRREIFMRGSAFFGQQPYDVVYCQFGSVALDILPLRSMPALSGKLVVAFRGADVSSYVRGSDCGVYTELFRDIDVALPNSEFFRQRLIDLGCEAGCCRVIRSGIRVQDFPYRPRAVPGDGIVRFIFVGRLVPKKGLDDCLKAFSLVRQSRDNFRLTIVGHGPLRREINELIDILQLKKHVRMIGAQPHHEVRSILDEHHVFISANKTPPSGDQEGITNTLKEAAATGLPLISTRHGGIPELVEDGENGYLVDEGDIERLAARIIQVMDHPELWPALGAKGRKRVVGGFDQETWNEKLAGELLQAVGMK
ncbi:MAG: glycosyltransferase [Candidatus Omnitrophica bacterium]|nr:glycosyltransferase [Candidatus Omnitrophota bacterium]